MKHAILGVGGVGGTVAAALARAGHPVTLLVRPEVLDRYPRELTIKSTELGSFSTPVTVASVLEGPVNVLWLTVKAYQLPESLQAAPPSTVGDGAVIPLLNGFEHVALLREHYGAGNVIPGTIRTASIRMSPGVIEHQQWHVPPGKPPIELAATGSLAATAEAIASEMSAAGIGCVVSDDEAGLLWRKLGLIAIGVMRAVITGAEREDSALKALQDRAVRETVEVAASVGVTLDEELMLRILASPLSGTSSFQRDLEAGKPTELDALIGAIVRAGREHGIGVGALEELQRIAAAKAASVG